MAVDCAGLGSPVEAAVDLCPDVDVRFVSELHTETRAHLLKNASPLVRGGIKRVTDDVTKRQRGEEEHVDLYVTGFPCQPYSSLGCRLGENDPRGRIVHSVVNVIRRTLPKSFILENVVGFRDHNDGKAFKQMMRKLKQIKNGAENAYDLHVEVLNTSDFGLPQSRRRLYVVGILHSECERSFTWPLPIPSAPLSALLDPKDPGADLSRLPEGNVAQANVVHHLKELRKRGVDPELQDCVIDCDSSPAWSQSMVERCPCLTHSRAQGHWLTSQARRLTPGETFRLQGLC